MGAPLVPKKQQILEWYFPDLVAEIEQAQELLNLPDNYDGEGAKPPTRAALAEATFFLRRGATSYCRKTGETVPAPKIMQDGKGGIDVLWKLAQGGLLINFQGTSVADNGSLHNQPNYYLHDAESGRTGHLHNIFIEAPELFQWLDELR